LPWPKLELSGLTSATACSAIAGENPLAGNSGRYQPQLVRRPLLKNQRLSFTPVANPVMLNDSSRNEGFPSESRRLDFQFLKYGES
jgi:hypothetical protein